MRTDKICPMCGTKYGPDHVFCPRDSSALRSTEELEGLIGSVIGNRYLVTERIGAGGMGEVFKAQDVRLQRVAAVKVMHRHLAGDPSAVARVMREAANGSRIRNAHVVDISDYGETDQGVPYLAMEFIPGESLRAVIERDGRLEPRRTASLLRQVARGLDAAHGLGIVHRDLKPDNLLVYRGDEGELVKIVDFGISRAVEDERQQLTRSGFITGTCEFMSPEQVAGRTLDHRTDVYALGLVAFKMLTGSLPFSGATPELAMMARLREAPRRLDQVVEGERWPEGVQEAIDHALALDPTARFSSAGDFARALEAAVEPQPDPTEVPGPRRRAPWRVPAAVAGVVLLGAVAAIRAFESEPPVESAESTETIAATPPVSESPAVDPLEADSVAVETPSPPVETTLSRPEPTPQPPVHRDTAALEDRTPQPGPDGREALDAYARVLRPDLPPDSARKVIADLDRLRRRLKTRRDSVDADIYQAEAYALTGDHERACALLEAARPYANDLQLRKMELWVEQGLCQSAVWHPS